MTPAQKRMYQRMFRHGGGIFDHEACDRDLRILFRMAKARLVDVEQDPSGDFCFCVKVVKGGRAA